MNGWPNGFAFIMSFMAPVWTIAAYDSCVLISEEATNARTAVPFAIISCVVSGGLLGWGTSFHWLLCTVVDLWSHLRAQ